MKRSVLLNFGLLVVFALTMACNTVHGIGKDIEAGGKAIERVAK
ncbi:MAG: entericidin A/B family lipoprotein [Azoarcus sp.]|jgi:predicted small secreted protein|nr:entericidin A/B family lipoprotein [Azoarcus sp.]